MLISRLTRRALAPSPSSEPETMADFVCHCRRVPYAVVDRAISRGARTIADLQRSTTACTRCFGCRFELERVLRERLGSEYEGEMRITLPTRDARTKRPQPMYMPVLAGFRGSPVDTRLIVFNWEGPGPAVHFRVDLMRPNAERMATWYHDLRSDSSAVVELSRDRIGSLLEDGWGYVKLVLDTAEVGSLRPYFHFATPTAVTSTHEKKGPKDPGKRGPRDYHWVFPVGRSRRPEELYFFLVNTQFDSMTGHRLVWQGTDGASEDVPLPAIGFEQSVLVPVHDHVRAVAEGKAAGSIRLDPPAFKVAGFMMRHDPEAQLWRVQHL